MKKYWTLFRIVLCRFGQSAAAARVCAAAAAVVVVAVVVVVAGWGVLPRDWHPATAGR